MKNARYIFAAHIEVKFNCPCMATQDAIDRIVAGEGYRGRQSMLDVLRGPHHTSVEFCASVLSAWKDRDILLATGRSRDWWLALIEAPDGLALEKEYANVGIC